MTGLAVILMGFLIGHRSDALAAESTPTPSSPSASVGMHVLLVVGAGGEDEFATNFTAQAAHWQTLCERERVSYTRFGVETNVEATDLEKLGGVISNLVSTGSGELWLVLIGHGTYDGKDAKFNLRGPDLGAAQLAEWLKPLKRPSVVLNFSSSSGPFLPVLSASNRVVVTATRSGNENNFARLGQYFAQALSDPSADLDQDGQTSLLEAYLSAAARVAEFYRTEGRLSPEHSLIDDNGDRLGTPSDWFRGLRAVKRGREGAGVDGLVAHQRHLVRSEAEAALDPARRERRDVLERELDGLRGQRATLGEDEYFRRLDGLLVELAQLYAPRS